MSRNFAWLTFLTLLTHLSQVVDSVLNGSFFFFGFRFGSVRESANRYFFELICGLIYSVVIVQKSANRTENRIETNRKPRNTGEPKVLLMNSAGQFSNSLTEPKFELKRTENREVNRIFSIQIPNNRTEPNRKHESLKKLYFDYTIFSLL